MMATTIARRQVKSCGASIFLICAIFACANSGDLPDEVLLVLADDSYVDATVTIDGQVVGLMRPIPDPKTWFDRLQFWVAEQMLKRSFDSNGVFNIVGINVDLESCPDGLHEIVVSKPGSDELRREFNYPESLYEGTVVVSFNDRVFSDECR